MPDTCFVIPCFNHGRFVRAAVESALAQGDDVSVMIVNDGSTDGQTAAACDACKSDRVAVIHQENRGLPGARNRGAAEAAQLWYFRYLAFLDADDFVRPGFVRALRGKIEEEVSAGRDDVSHAYCQEELIELGQGIWRVPEWDPLLLMITNLHPVTALIRRDRFEQAGGFDETMRLGYEDWDFWLKLAERGWRGVRVREPLFVWRRHSHDTMVMEAVKRHDDLYREIIARHADLYTRRATDIMSLANTLLRKFEANWIDETGYPIQLQFLQKSYQELLQLRQTAARDQELAARAGADLEKLRAYYESFAAVKIHHALHRFAESLPGPLATGAKRAMSAARRLIVGSPGQKASRASGSTSPLEQTPAPRPDSAARG